jgi:hypothetical protein
MAALSRICDSGHSLGTVVRRGQATANDDRFHGEARDDEGRLSMSIALV